MSMNFNKNPPTTPTPKKNNNKKIVEIIIVAVLGSIAAIALIHEAQRTQSTISSVASEPQPTPASDLQQKLFDKCQKLQAWYRSLDGFENTDYHCDKYTDAWNGLVK